MTEQLYGLTLPQHQQLGALVNDAKAISRPGTSGPSRAADRYRGVARVVLLGSINPAYNPKTTRDCALFQYLPDGNQTTLEMTGQGLQGDLVLTIGGIEIHIDCQSTTAQLQAALFSVGISRAACRATAFPGLWEFDFNSGIMIGQATVISAEPYEPAPGDTETPIYTGGVQVRQEGWVSLSSDGITPDVVRTVDWMPFELGAIKPGAIGGAHWHYGAGWLVMGWQCRDWSFASGGGGGSG